MAVACIIRQQACRLGVWCPEAEKEEEEEAPGGACTLGPCSLSSLRVSSYRGFWVSDGTVTPAQSESASCLLWCLSCHPCLVLGCGSLAVGPCEEPAVGIGQWGGGVISWVQSGRGLGAWPVVCRMVCKGVQAKRGSRLPLLPPE